MSAPADGAIPHWRSRLEAHFRWRQYHNADGKGSAEAIWPAGRCEGDDHRDFAAPDKNDVQTHT